MISNPNSTISSSLHHQAIYSYMSYPKTGNASSVAGTDLDSVLMIITAGLGSPGMERCHQAM
ncbi:MAG: hypothetical protein IPF93_14610 [Saprospiraceae bacterium]|nr:hypothetical protein [Saprospiraceae bacterium]